MGWIHWITSPGQGCPCRFELVPCTNYGLRERSDWAHVFAFALLADLFIRANYVASTLPQAKMEPPRRPLQIEPSLPKGSWTGSFHVSLAEGTGYITSIYRFVRQTSSELPPIKMSPSQPWHVSNANCFSMNRLQTRGKQVAHDACPNRVGTLVEATGPWPALKGNQQNFVSRSNTGGPKPVPTKARCVRSLGRNAVLCVDSHLAVGPSGARVYLLAPITFAGVANQTLLYFRRSRLNSPGLLDGKGKLTRGDSCWITAAPTFREEACAQDISGLRMSMGGVFCCHPIRLSSNDRPGPTWCCIKKGNSQKVQPVPSCRKKVDRHQSPNPTCSNMELEAHPVQHELCSPPGRSTS